MKIKLIKQNINGATVFKYKPFKYCCKQLETTRVIKMSKEDMYGKNLETPKFLLCSPCDSWGYEDAYDVDVFSPISFCPFCGEKIEIEVVAEEDVTEYYKELNEKIDKLRKEKRETDSKHYSNELTNKIGELNNEIYYMYSIQEYKEK